MSNTSVESIRHLIDLLKIEKKEDYDQYQRKMRNTSIEERKEKGVTWYPVVINNQYISTGERISLELERTTDIRSNHSFQVGSVVSVFIGDSDQSFAGVISWLRKDKMKIALNSSEFLEWDGGEKLGVNLLFDESSYRAMENALKQVAKAEGSRMSELRKVFYGERKAKFENGHQYASYQLNNVQNEALSNIFNALDMAIIHGPPGTGKTTTVVNAIKETVKNEKQVLVCAQSNAAVDLLVEKLDSLGIDVLRLGHPARLTPNVIENSLDTKITKHPSFKELKQVRKRAAELKKMALKYKRNFGKAEREQRGMILKEARLLREDADRIEEYITETLLENAKVVASTLIGANHYLLQKKVFKTVFIDEASQALEPACWIPILKAQRVVMAGDHYQLPPTVKSLQAAKLGLEHTLFEKAITNNQCASIMLETQYRMHPDIMNFSSQYFYNGKLKVADEVILREKTNETFKFEFIDTAGCGFDEKVNRETLSTYNDHEAGLLVKHLSNHLKEGRVGVIAPYRAQIEVIKERLMESGELDPIREDISVNTVDAFQGQERDIVYISLTRSNGKGEIGFLKEYRRMNVAMTRAKSRLVIIGDSATLCTDAFYDQIVEYAQKINSYKSAFEYLYTD